MSKEMSDYERLKMRIFAQIKKSRYINISFQIIKRVKYQVVGRKLSQGML